MRVLLLGGLLLAATSALAADPLPTLAKRTAGLDRRDGFVPFYWDAREGKLLLEVSRPGEELLYGAGLPLLECLRLRVKDLDLARGEIVVRDGKGRKDRVTMIPARLIDTVSPVLHNGALAFGLRSAAS